MSAPELNKKVNVSWGLIFMAAMAMITAVTTINKVLSLDTVIEKENKLLREEIERVREAGEVRQDWMNNRIDRKVKNHELIYHKKD